MSDLSRKPEFVREVRRLIRREYRRPWWTAWAVLLVVAFAGGAIAAVTLFAHTLPSESAATLTTPCAGTLVAANLPPGNVLFTCPNGGAPLVSTGGSVTPTFSGLSTETLALVAHVASATTCSLGTALTTGTPINLAAGSYDYCIENAPSPSPSVSVSWSQ